MILILMMLLAALPASAEEAVAKIVYDADLALVGETVTVDLWAKGFPKTVSASVLMDYDPQVLEPIGFESKIPINLTVNEVLREGTYSIIWLDVGNEIEGDVLLGTLTFKVLAMPASKATALKATDAEHNVLINAAQQEIFFALEQANIPIYNNHPFTDVKNQWFREAVLFAYNRDLMNGKGNGIFDPNGNTTRAELVTVLYRLEGLPQVVAASPFTDLTKTRYKDAVGWAFEHDIVNGKTATTFAPNAAITRQEIAAILYRYAQYKGIDTGALGDLSVYPDADQLSNYAKVSMQWASAQGLISGVKKSATLTILSPKTSATRAQIATRPAAAAPIRCHPRSLRAADHHQWASPFGHL